MGKKEAEPISLLAGPPPQRHFWGRLPVSNLSFYLGWIAVSGYIYAKRVPR
jgi:hypothetical protein